MSICRLGPGAIGRTVAKGAVGAKSGQNVIGVLRLCHFRLMASFAIDRCASKFILAASPVTGLTIGNGMDSGQRKTFLRVHFKKIFSPLPILRRMAVLAIGAELAQMMIRMTIRAGSCDMAEHFVLVAGGTWRRLMRPGQVEAGFIMLEFHRLPHRGPGIRGMAVLAVPFN